MVIPYDRSCLLRGNYFLVIYIYIERERGEPREPTYTHYNLGLTYKLAEKNLYKYCSTWTIF